MQRVRRRGRLLRWLLVGTGPLSRGTDRVEMGFRWLVLLMTLVTVPLAWATASAAHDHELAVAAEQARERHMVLAVVVTTPRDTNASASDTVDAQVAWTTDDGTPKGATVPVPATARTGDPLTVWTGPDGRPTTPPLDADAPLLWALRAGGLAAVALPLTAACLLWLLRGFLDIHRARRWEARWQAVEPLWTSKGR